MENKKDIEIKWSEDLKTGVDEIDNQHKRIIHWINMVHSVNETEMDEEEVEKMIRFLGGYIIDHFSTEEEYMIKYNYPGYDEHKEQHITFLKNFAMLKRLFREEGNPCLMLFVIEHEYIYWLAKHIKKYDKELAQFLKKMRTS